MEYGPEYLQPEDDIDIFRIQGETKEFLDLLEEVKSIGRNSYLANSREIKKWMEDRKTTKPPSPTAKNEEEKKLGIALQGIKSYLKLYMKKQTEEKENYREEHPEIDEIIEIVQEIDKNNIPIGLKNARKIKEWMEKRKTTTPPSSTAKDEEEKKLGQALLNIKTTWIKKYMKLETEEKKENYRIEHPEIDEIIEIVQEIDKNNIPIGLENARKIKEWMEKRRTTKPPSPTAKDKEEKVLGRALERIRRTKIKKYMQLETEEKKENYRIEHPEIDEIIEIVQEIDKNNIPVSLENARKIKKWMEERKTTTPPSLTAEDEEEKVLAKALQKIRTSRIKKYEEIETEEKKENYRVEHPEIDEIIEIVQEIDKNNIPIGLENARKIKEWMEKKNTEKPPSEESKDAEEKKLGQALTNIRTNWLNPYMKLTTEEEKDIYRKSHPHLDEVLKIIGDIYIQSGNDKRKELGILIKQDLEKREQLKQAKQLEEKYKQVLEQQSRKKLNLGDTQDGK